ncbi:SAM-dependent methyltransferase, partial [Salmonella enterica]|uniref:SAM-dependent methyltransferase n=1 Tax=Salmonella enterica TaxID=28901 RepID=UPI00398C827C
QRVGRVGGGPSQPRRLTLKGLPPLHQPDIGVCDLLVSDNIMNMVRRDAVRVLVGKRAGYHCVPQEEINQILLRDAQKGKRVVRLQGGDPLILGRRVQDLETLCQACISFSVVPVTSAVARPHPSSALPLTPRHIPHAVTR